jgi:hypothetical protein
MNKITEQSFVNAAKKIGCSVAMVKAVYEVESQGSGFLPTGEVKILFEPHIFWKELRNKGIKPIVSDICYPTWGAKPYGKISEQHKRLDKAVQIDRDAALKSASWGLFQILGNNYKLCGCASLQGFINKMSEGEESQLELFVNYIINSHLDDEMREEDCAGFARSYNGPMYSKNSYDKKIKTALNKYKKI